MRIFFYRIFENVKSIFSGRNLFYHLLAILLTAFFVLSGFDWWYWLTFKDSLIRTILSPGIALGALVPILATVIIYLVGWTQNNIQIKKIAAVIGQSSLLGLLLSDVYKAFTGRVPPEVFHSTAPLVDISREFRFGFLRGGVFWGWPSSHTTVAFAMSVALICMYPKNRTLKIVALFYAFYIGFSVSMSIHWFSEFVAGAIYGTIVGIVVGRRFRDFADK